jgi:hypothetical protein
MNKLVIVLRTERHEPNYREVVIPTTKAEFFQDRIEGYNDEMEHFYITVNNGYFLAGHLSCCDGWPDETAVFDFCNVYDSSYEPDPVEEP